MKKTVFVILVLTLVLSLCACGAGQRETTVLVYTDISLSDAESRSLGAQINAIEGVQSARFITGEEALEVFLEQHESAEAFSGIDLEVLPDRYDVTVKAADLDAVIAELEAIDGVAEVISERDIDWKEILGALLQSKTEE